MLPVDVRDRVEFVSDGWIDAARSFLEDAVAADPAVAATTFSVCESFIDAPPALGLADDRAVWHFALDEGRVDVGRGDLDGADVRVEGGYQPTLAMAQTVYAAGRDRRVTGGEIVRAEARSANCAANESAKSATRI